MTEITIKRIKTARHIRLRVFEDGRVILTAPLRAPQQLVDNFLAEHQEWLKEKIAVSATKQQTLTTQRDRLFLRGTEYDFRLAVSATKRPGVAIISPQLVVTAPTEDHEVVRLILEKWYRQQANKRFTARVPLLADLVGRDVTRVTIRDQRTRWGSCSSRNTISLNWRLIMAPDHVSDYVIYHELAHLTHMNHSTKFWQLVSEYVPDYKKAEEWLKTHHRLLRF